MTNVAIVGPGYIGQMHMDAWKQLPEVAVTAVISRSRDRGEAACRRAGGDCRWYPGLEDALAAGNIQIVDICAPPHLHGELTAVAARAGCHVLCEKPAALELAAFEGMEQVCRENGVRFMTAHILRWFPEYRMLQQYLRAGAIGPLHMLSTRRACQHPTWGQWHRDPAQSGGGLFDLGIHEIDYLYTLFGTPATVYATGWKSLTGCWNHVVASFTWADGNRAATEFSEEMTGNCPFAARLRATGDGGTLEFDGAAMTWYPADTGEVVPVALPQTDAFLEEIRDFLAAVREGGPMPVTWEQTRQVLKMTHAVLESLQTGCVVHMAPE